MLYGRQRLSRLQEEAKSFEQGLQLLGGRLFCITECC